MSKSEWKHSTSRVDHSFQVNPQRFTRCTESADAEFDDYQRHFTSLEQAAEKLIKDTKAFSEGVTCMDSSHKQKSNWFAPDILPPTLSAFISSETCASPTCAALFTAGAGFATHFGVIFQPIAGEFDLIGKHPDVGHTIRNVTKYETAMQELRELIGPELELIDTRIAGPAKELQAVMKLIRKSITKRDHKVCSESLRS